MFFLLAFSFSFISLSENFTITSLSAISSVVPTDETSLTIEYK